MATIQRHSEEFDSDIEGQQYRKILIIYTEDTELAVELQCRQMQSYAYRRNKKYKGILLLYSRKLLKKRILKYRETLHYSYLIMCHMQFAELISYWD